MQKIELLKWKFLNELAELNRINKDLSFKIGLEDGGDRPKEFKSDYIDYLYKNGAIEIRDEYFGVGITSSNKRAPIAPGAPMRMFGYKPIEMTVKVKNPYFQREFDNQEDIIETKGKNLIACYHDKDQTILMINKEPLKFKGAKGLILFYLYLTRKVTNPQDFKTYNAFIEDEKYSDKNIVGFTKFRQSITAINRRIKKEAKNYITSVIDKLEGDAKRNEYKWNPKFSKK